MTIDHGYVPPQQWAVHSDLLEWARWARPAPPAGSVAPMFRHYRAPWAESVPSAAIDSATAMRVERAVSRMAQGDGARYAQALRWWYVHPCSPARQCRTMGCSHEALAHLVSQGREMVKNHLRGTGLISRLAPVARADAHS